MGKLVRITGDFSGKQRVRKNVIGQHGHVARYIGRAGNTVVAVGENIGCPLHAFRETIDVSRRENRRHRLARTPPDIAFRRQQSIAQDGAKDALAYRRHLVILRIVDEHMTDQPRIIGDDRMGEGPVDGNPGFIIRRLPPQLQRIAVNGANKLQCADRTGTRYWRRGQKRSVSYPFITSAMDVGTSGEKVYQLTGIGGSLPY